MQIIDEVYGYVYVHINKINKKAYVGQTIQAPEKRWANGKGYIESTYFYNAIQKYGWDNFEHIILEEGLFTLEELNNKEKYWISFYDSLNNGYNLREGGNNSKLTEEHKTKIQHSNAQTLGHPVICLNTGIIYESVNAAKRDTGAEHIESCCNGILKSAGKDAQGNALIWKYVKDYTGKEKIIIRPQKRAKSKVLCVETNIEYNSAKDAERDTGVDSGSIGRVCNGKRKSAGGYHWKWI